LPKKHNVADLLCRTPEKKIGINETTRDARHGKIKYSYCIVILSVQKVFNFFTFKSGEK